MNKAKINLIFFILILIIGFFLRYYGLNKDSFWTDEMISFWVSSPDITLTESLSRHNLGDANTFLFNYLLKYYFIFFDYNVFSARLFPLIIGSFSMILFGLLCYELKRSNIFLLGLFLFATNSYLINYSIELRPAILFLFFSLLNIFFFIRLIKKIKKFKITFLKTIPYVFSSLILVNIHVFGIIVLFSQIIYAVFITIKFNQNMIKFYFAFLISIIFIFLTNLNYMIEKHNDLENWVGWVMQQDSDFYYDYFFSNFFGSKIMGFFFIILFLSLILKFRNKILSDSNLNFYFFILIFFSYSIPLFYGFIFKPILLDRYIIFVLIPILYLIISLIDEIQNKKIKNILIVLIIFFSLSDNLVSLTKSDPSKPDFYNTINHLERSQQKNFIINASERRKLNEIFSNYFKYLNIAKKTDLKLLNENLIENYKGSFWVVCYTDISADGCNITNLLNKKEYKVIKEASFYLVDLKLVKLI